MLMMMKEGKEKEKEERRGEQLTLKSSNPNLTGGEKREKPYFSLFFVGFAPFRDFHRLGRAERRHRRACSGSSGTMRATARSAAARMHRSLQIVKNSCKTL